MKSNMSLNTVTTHFTTKPSTLLFFFLRFYFEALELFHTASGLKGISD